MDRRLQPFSVEKCVPTHPDTRVFFSKFLMGGDSKFSVPDGDEAGWGGGTCEKNLTEAKTAHLMQN